MREQYQAAWTNAAKLGKKQLITSAMLDQGIWTTGLYDLDGHRCESVAELLVFNLLLQAGVEFIRHPLLPFERQRRTARADALLPGQKVYLEIWMCSEAGLAARHDDVPDWFVGYANKREEKLAAYKTAGLEVVSLEAEISRLVTTKAFLEHAVALLGPVCGVTWQDPQELRISGSCAALQWRIEEFADYARANNLEKLSDFQEHPHRVYYNVLKARDMRDALRVTLDREHGRKSFVRRPRRSVPASGGSD